MYHSAESIFEKELAAIAAAGLHKEERVITSRQGREVAVGGRTYLNFCSNNYLGLAGGEVVAEAARAAMDTYGFGLASVRFICGTQDVHRTLERETAAFLKMEDAILFSSCMMANMGIFNALLGSDDIILSDALNHASIIDGMRLAKAEKYIYKHMDMTDLERGLQEARGRRMRCIVTDGVFSMDGDITPLKEICDLAEKYDALVVVDDSHATGFVGANGRGTPEHCGVLGRVDAITSTYGKALGGAGGGYVAGRNLLVALLRERARTYLFSNSLPPAIAGAARAAIRFVAEHPELREQLWENTRYFRTRMKEAGFAVPASEHPIVPVMIGDAKKAKALAGALFDEGIYVIAFSHPVVPDGAARIRVQISAEHTREDLNLLVGAFVEKVSTVSDADETCLKSP